VIKNDPISIGRLERFASDRGKTKIIRPKKNNRKIAIIGSGPSSLTCAADLAKLGYQIKIFEALHKTGGVLRFGIPSFRLPKNIIDKEIEYIKAIGVQIDTNMVIGKVLSLEDLQKDHDAIFMGVGAGLPRFMGIKGENKIGVVTANEFLTRINLMNADKFPKYETPIEIGKKVVVVGGGNVAMDAARCARRLGSDVVIVYRRTIDEMPARREEIQYAKEEGIEFLFLSNPVKIVGKEQVTGIYVQSMMLGEEDESGRRSPIALENSDYKVYCDLVIMAIGRDPNKLLLRGSGLRHDMKGHLIVTEDFQTSTPKIFAGGDIVNGETTVVQAMSDGKKAAKGIHEMLQKDL
jgi:glutamate synthase (NADPH/NADH) small chain